jgi:hypothetical protein
MKTLLIVPFLCAALFCRGQFGKDSVLMTERSIDRPITVHGGQFRATAGYDLGITTKRYDGEGNVLHLRDEGISYATHAFLFDMRYGIHEFVQIGMRSYYRMQTQRNQQVLSISWDVYEVFEINKKSGLEDLLFSLHLRAPFKTRKFDLVVGGGYLLPVGDRQASQPTHEISEASSGSGKHYSVIYNYHHPWNSGVNSVWLEGAFKFRTASMAISAAASYAHGITEGEGLRWSHQVSGDQFQYRSEPYAYQTQDVLNWHVEWEYQIAPWFDLSIQLINRQGARGWDETYGVKVSRVENALLSFNPGYEILVTPKFWLRQRIQFPISGQSSDAPLTFSTSLVYNFFPFN